jgi:multidrug efflux pump subunit AcrA (membrane-fusion protein)
MFGSARVFNDNPQPAILIPDEVIGTDQSQKFVYVLTNENRVEARPIVLGPLHTSELRIIRSGVGPNDRIIIGNIQKIRPTMEVEPEARVLSEK